VNVCPATAGRIEEIIARNRIRAEACLPLLSIPKELRRMKEATIAAKFETFANSHRGAVWDEVLATEREARCEPNWYPSGWMEGMAFQSEVSRILRQRFNRSHRLKSVGTLSSAQPAIKKPQPTQRAGAYSCRAATRSK
jgi:hypothetical protein